IACCDRAPNFTLTDIDGKTFSLSDFKGRVVILNFLTSRCTACIHEAQQIKAVRNEFGEELVMISLSIALDYDTNERLREFRDKYDINWILARDTENVFGSYNVPRIPMVFVIDKWSDIRYEHVDWFQELPSMLIENVTELLEKTTDVNADGKVDQNDVSIIANIFSAEIGETGYDRKMDLDDDGTIDMRDVAKVAKDSEET
ncbi:MAG: redoxin domain-containing protein, partial [Candidatus Bathyarchaeota archaeon]